MIWLAYSCINSFSVRNFARKFHNVRDFVFLRTFPHIYIFSPSYSISSVSYYENPNYIRKLAYESYPLEIRRFRAYATFPRKTQQILIPYIDFFWPELITLIPGFLKTFSITNSSICFFQYLRKSPGESKSKYCILEGLCVFFNNFLVLSTVKAYITKKANVLVFSNIFVSTRLILLLLFKADLAHDSFIYIFQDFARYLLCMCIIKSYMYQLK